MLRRHSNKLNRRKSTSSVHSKHESIDPEVARHHAHVAATLAFARAQERNQADASRSVPRNPPPPPPHQRKQEWSDQSRDGDRILKRQQSVRFAGPHAVERRQSAGGRTAHSQIVPQQSSATLRPVAMTTNAPVPAAYRPPSRSSSIGKGSISKATAENLAIVNGAYNEYYTCEDDVASTPSSYRRIRRSKSMFSPLKAPNIFYTNGTPERSQHEQEYSNSRTSEDQQSHRSLRAPKSMSFLRVGKDRTTTALRERNDVAVQLARDRFFSQTTQQRLREQPSFLFRSKAQRQEKTFRKSVRSTSANSYGLPISSEENPPPKEFGLKDAARKASRSLRSKLKRVFGRTKDEPMEIPNQQVDAKETHVRRYLGDMPVGQYSNVPHPNEASLSRVSARVPSLHAVGSNQKLRSHAGSVKSARSFATDRSDDHSRVTSWNTSTGVNTMTSQTARVHAAEKEQQRLSIINEHGTHMSSSSLKRPEMKKEFSTYSVLQKQGHPPAPGPVDSARVYSALMKRIDENSPKQKHQVPYEATDIEPLPPQSSSAKTVKTSRSQATIRCVTAEPSEVSPHSDHDHQWVKADSFHVAKADSGFSESHVHQWVAAEAMRGIRHADDVFSDNNKENIPVRQYTYSDSTTRSYHTVPELNGPSPQEMALKNELLLMPPKAMRDSRSTFFGGTTAFTISRTPSPFRRALAESSSHASDQPYLPRRLSPLRNPLFSAGSADHLSDKDAHEPDAAYSESVYSRTTSGRTPDIFATLPIQTLPAPRTSILPNRSGNGDAVIIDSTKYRPLIPATRKGHSVTSSMGSVEWKKWMSSEVAKLERAKDSSNAGGYINYALPTMPKSYTSGHHVREYSQIDNDDVDVSEKIAPAKQPLGIIQQNSNIPPAPPVRTVVTRRSISSLVDNSINKVNHQQSNTTLPPPALKPILKNRSTSSLIENINNASSVPRPALPPPAPPPLPPMRSSLRPVPSKSSMRSVATVNSITSIPSPVKISSMNGRHVLHKRNGSTTTLRSTKSVEALTVTTKLVKRSGRPVSSNPSPSGLPVPVRNDNRFGSNSSRSRSSVRANRFDNTRAKNVTEDVYESEEAGLIGPELGRTGGSEMSEGEVQTNGSKRMVDMFLSSRRKRIVSASDEGAQVFL